MSLSGSKAARALIRRLEKACTSPTVLFYLALPFRVLKKVEMGQLLIDLCAELNVALPFDSDFFLQIEKASRPLKPIAGSFFRIEKSKDKAIQSFRAELARRRAKSPKDKYLYMGACMPTCFQTLRGRSDAHKEHSDSLFVVHSCPETAFHHAVELLRAGECAFSQQVIPVMQVYEMRLHDAFLSEQPHNRLGCIIVDWEVKESEVAGRLDREQLAALCDEFPLWLYQRMHALKHVDHRAVVTAVVKNKTRDLPGGDRKHSIHVTYNVCGVPATDLHHILRDCLCESSHHLALFKHKDPAKRALAFCDPESGEDCIGEHPELGFDHAGITGNTGVAMLFSRKRAEDPFPGLLHTVAFSEGQMHVLPQRLGVPTALNPEPFPELSSDGQHDLDRLSKEQAVYFMYSASCSAGKPGMVAPTRQSTSEGQARQIRTAAKRPAAFGVPPPAAGRGGSGREPGSFSKLLPGKFRELMSKHRGQERPNSALIYSHNLRQLCVEGADPDAWHFTHVVKGFPCPVHLCDPDDPREHCHSSNAVILAFNEALPESVFARCTYCPTPSTLHCTAGEAGVVRDAELVRGKNGTASRWLLLREEGLSNIMDDIQKKSTKAVRADKLVKRKNQEFEEKHASLKAAREAKRRK